MSLNRGALPPMEDPIVAGETGEVDLSPPSPADQLATSLLAGLAPDEADAAWMERAALKLFANMGETITVIDAAGRVIATSATERGDHGYDSGSWGGRNLIELVHPDDQPGMLEQSAIVLGIRGVLTAMSAGFDDPTAPGIPWPSQLSTSSTTLTSVALWSQHSR